MPMNVTRVGTAINGKDGLIPLDEISFTVARGEPVFIIRGQDKGAAYTVRQWTLKAKKLGVSEEKISEAWIIVNAMLGWPNQKVPD